MEPQKVIAICKSRGNSELGEDSLLSYNGGEAYAVDFDRQTQLSDFKKEIAETFRYSAEDMSIKVLSPWKQKDTYYNIERQGSSANGELLWEFRSS